MTRHQQQGNVLALVMLGLLAAGVLATIAYGSYYQIARGSSDTVNRANASALLTQAAYTLAAEAAVAGDIDTDGITEPIAGSLALNDGWEAPASSGAPKTDTWGSKLQYCAWDNGATNASIGRITGSNPAAASSLQFALISAGPDKAFDTTCAQVLTHYMAGAPSIANGDDGVRTMSVAQMNQGVGGTYYFGDAVANVSNLPLTDAPAGKMRIVKDTQLAYIWNGSSWLPANAGAWLVLTDAAVAATCASYPAGVLARDNADNLYMCTANASRPWKKVSP
jgi:hypothetical protein